MAIYKQIKSHIEDFVFFNSAFKNRVQDGQNDLKKSISKGYPLTYEEEQEIVSFWRPYLVTSQAKKAFNIQWFNIYKRTNVFGFDLRYYIPDSFYYAITDTFFSDYKAAQYIDDKNLYDLLFYNVKQPKTICRKIGDLYLNEKFQVISKDNAILLCKNCGKVIIKPSVNSCAGSGINKWDLTDGDDVLFNLIKQHYSFVVQEYINQHRVFSAFNESCVNTIRIITFLFDNRVHLLSSVLIMGGENATTNHLHRGGIVCGVKKDGRLRSIGFDGHLNQFKRHPNGTVFEGCSIPGYQKCVEIALELTPRFCQTSRLISWDFTIGEDCEPILIETNLSWGGCVQIADGPVFGDITPDVLNYMRLNKMHRFSAIR